MSFSNTHYLIQWHSSQEPRSENFEESHDSARSQSKIQNKPNPRGVAQLSHGASGLESARAESRLTLAIDTNKLWMHGEKTH